MAPAPRSVDERLHQGQDLLLGGFVEDHPVAQRLTVGCEESGERLALDAEIPPAVEGRIPQERERLDSELGTELLGETETVLGAQADDVEGGPVMSASKLLDARRFALAGRSVRIPEPHQKRTLPGVVACEGHVGSGCDIDDIHRGQRTVGVGTDRLGPVDGVGRCWVARGGAVAAVTAGRGDQQERRGEGEGDERTRRSAARA